MSYRRSCGALQRTNTRSSRSHVCRHQQEITLFSVHTPLYDPSRGSLSLGHDDPWPKYGIYAREMLPARSSESIHTPPEVLYLQLNTDYKWC